MFADALELARLLRRQHLREEALRRHREARFLALVRHAFANVPYYRARFGEAGLRPDDVRSLDDLERIPVTTKEDLRRVGVEGAVDGRGDRAGWRRFTTSGTSGAPLAVHLSAADRRRRRLVDFRAMLRWGLRPRDRIAMLGPTVTRPSAPHERLGLFRTTMIPHDLHPEEQARRLAAARPTLLWGYPGYLRAVVENAPAELMRRVRPRILVTSAETLDPATERMLREAFAWREHYELYGAIEVGRIASECPAHAGLHVEADRALVELEPVAGSEDLASVVVTALDGEAMPMIRYRLGDLSVPLAGPCRCGSPFPRIAAPRGRDWQLLRLPSGRLVPPLLLNAALKDFPALDRFRLVQLAADRFRVESEFLTAAPANRLEDLRRVITSALGEPVGLDVIEVRFERIPGEKFQPFASRTG